MRLLPCLFIALSLTPQALPAQARDTTRAQVVDTLTVTGRYDNPIGLAATASEGRIGAVDLRLRPILREGELLETVPGLIVTQHSGDGGESGLRSGIQSRSPSRRAGRGHPVLLRVAPPG